MMSVCYLDCSLFMKGLLNSESVPSDLGLRIHLGDPPRAAIPSLVHDAQVLLNGHTGFDDELMAACPALRSIVFLGTGASSYIDMEAAARRGIRVRTIKGYGDRSIAEHAFALMLAAARKITAMDRGMRDGRWEPLEGIELRGRTLGIVGGGGVGAELARLAHGFGMNVLVWNRSPLSSDLAAFQADLDEVLRNSDVISIHLALTPETRHFIGAAELARMKHGAIIVNTARGAVVDETALIAALSKGTLEHAALDVFEAEPLSSFSPLLELENVSLTAHAAFKTREASVQLIRHAIDIATKDIEALLAGRELSC